MGLPAFFLRAAMEGLLPDSRSEKQKKLPVPPWDGSFCFCDTTQIDACASTRFVRHHARPMGNGWGPVGSYWDFPPFRPPSKAHSPAAPCPDCTIRDSLEVCCAGYSSFSQVFRIFGYVSLYRSLSRLSTRFRKKTNFGKSGAEGSFAKKSPPENSGEPERVLRFRAFISR